MQAPPDAFSDPAAPPPISPTLLLVDDEMHILSAMKRLLRREGYEILTANSGEEGLAVLRERSVDVIVSDQRMPGMTGIEFLREAKVLRPDTIRLVLSGYTDIDSITGAINEGAIFRFLTKPWDDEQLKAQIADAFHQKQLVDENHRLAAALQAANLKLAQANAQLQTLLSERDGRITRDETAMDVLHEVLELLPWPFVGVDIEGMIVTMNARAEELFGNRGGLLGLPARTIMSDTLLDDLLATPPHEGRLTVGGIHYRVHARMLGAESAPRGRALILFTTETDHA